MLSQANIQRVAVQHEPDCDYLNICMVGGHTVDRIRQPTCFASSCAYTSTSTSKFFSHKKTHTQIDNETCIIFSN
jgi:hypothetical protein